MNSSAVAHTSTSTRAPSGATLAAANTFWGFLTSSVALREGAKLLLVGSILEFARRVVTMLWTAIFDYFFVTVEFEDRDETFSWMMFWLSRHPRWKKLRSVQVSTFKYGQSGVSNLVPGEEEEKRSGSSRRVAYVPSHNRPVNMWFHGTWMSVTLIRTQGDMWNRRGDERLKITLFTRKLAKLDELLLEAKQSFKKHSEGRINIYVQDTNNEWTLSGSRPRRPLSSVVLERGIKERLVSDIKEFLGSEKWYADRGIPWRRGYLLYGSPGSGKTSLIHSLAGEFGLDIYVIALSKKSLDDSILNELISKIPPKCLAIMEDIDAAFFRGVTRETPISGSAHNTPDGHAFVQAPVQSTSQVTLSGLLGAIDGIAAQEGRVLFATTNKYSALDPALVRPGRLDVHVRFDNAGRKQAAALYRCFFPAESDDVKGFEDEESPSDEATSPTAVGSCPGSPVESPLLQASPDDYECDDGQIDLCGDDQPLSWPECKVLSEIFARRIPEGEFSMASLQGLLMQYRSRPRRVINEVGAWVKAERLKRAEREGGGLSGIGAGAKRGVASPVETVDASNVTNTALN